MSFTEKIWVWDSTEEGGKLSALYSFGYALEYLSMDAEYQIEHLPGGCPACEVWSTYIAEAHHFLQVLEGELSLNVTQAVKNLLEAYDNLSDSEAECENKDIFRFNGWNNIRTASKNCMKIIEWGLLKIYKADINRAL